MTKAGLSVKETAQALDVSSDAVLKLVESGELESIGPLKRLIDVDSLHRYASNLLEGKREQERGRPHAPRMQSIKDGTEVTVVRASEMLGVPEAEVVRMITTGKLKARKEGRTLLLDCEAVREYARRA